MTKDELIAAVEAAMVDIEDSIRAEPRHANSLLASAFAIHALLYRLRNPSSPRLDIDAYQRVDR